MNVKLTIIKRITPVGIGEIAAIGEVTLEEAMEWIGEMRSASDMIEVIDAPEGNLDLSCAVYLPPAGKHLMQFQLVDRSPAASWEYQFSGDHALLDQLVDHFAVLEAREGLPQTN